VGSSLGIDGAKLATHQHRFARFQIGHVDYASPSIRVSPLRLVTGDMLLGADWLRGNRVWISYATHQVIIQPVGRPPTG